MPSECTNPEAPLKRTMGLFPAAMVAGIILGASIFVQPSEISRHVSSIPALLKSIRGLPISEQDRAKILGGNAERLLKLS